MSETSETGQLSNVALIDTKDSDAKHSPRKTRLQRMLSAFGGSGRSTSPSSYAEYPLTERLSFITKYVETVSKEHVLSVVRTPGYDLLTPYLGLKVFNGQPAEQKKMLSGIANSFCSGEGYAGAAEVVKDIVSKPDVVLSDVSPKKISRIAIWGPRQVESRAQTVAKEAFEGNEMPVLVAYGGLHALKAVIQNSREGGQAMLVFPQKDDTTEETLGYKLIRSQGEVEVVSLIQSDLLTDKKLALIDDATHTGATLQNMRGVFPNATIQERPLFKT